MGINLAEMGINLADLGKSLMKFSTDKTVWFSWGKPAGILLTQQLEF